MTNTVVHLVGSSAFGGTEQALLHLLAGVDRHRWRSVLFHYPEPGLAPLLDPLRRLGVELRAIPRVDSWREAKTVPQLIRALRAERPTVFHAHLNWPLACRFELLAATLVRVPSILATVQLFDSRYPFARLERLEQRVVAAGVERYVAVSHDIADQLHRRLGVPPWKIDVVHNAIPLATFAQARNPRLRAALTGDLARPLVVTTARLDAQKGLSYLLEAAALLPDAVFVVIGEGPERAALEARVAELDLRDRVRLLGYRSDVPDLLAACDLFVLPSLYEGLPLALLEAMAGGVPVVASAIGGVDEAVENGVSGLLVPPADPRALAAAIRRLLDDPCLARRLGATGRLVAQRSFSVESMVERITLIYDELAHRSGCGHAGA